jgi:hypothetical protein
VLGLLTFTSMPINPPSNHCSEYPVFEIVLVDYAARQNSGQSIVFPQRAGWLRRQDGILTLATSNHPERLDPAILDRPSRFDRKYPFDLPELDERKTYIGSWNETLRPALRLADAGVETAAQTTDGFSFAYLKELFLSALMRWISAPQPGAMDAIIDEPISVLREHMGVMAEVVPDMDYGPPGGFQHGHPAMFHRGMRGPHHGPPQPTSPEDIPM